MINGTLTQEEQDFVESAYTFNWLSQNRFAIENSIPRIETFARNHPNTVGVLNNLVYGLRYWVLPRVI
jgi:hypothetical protein